jgi:hypothetical protein
MQKSIPSRPRAPVQAFESRSLLRRGVAAHDPIRILQRVPIIVVRTPNV